MKKRIFSIVVCAFLLFALAIGASGASDSLEKEAPGRTYLIDVIKKETISGTASFANEGPENLFDNDVTTKFCTNTFPAVVTWELTGAHVVDAVVIATANDNSQYPGRNPATWTLSASQDRTNYVTLFEGKASDLDDVDFTYFLFTFNNDVAYPYYKLEISGPESGTVMQISELVLCKKASLSTNYPSSGIAPKEGHIITGDLIGLETGWGGNPDAGRHAAFDGDANTFFDPNGTGDGYCGIDAGEPFILTEIHILPRNGYLDRFLGAEIQGSNDGENWTSLWYSDDAASAWEWQVITADMIENNTGWRYFRYFNEISHGDVAEVELYGYSVSGNAEAKLAETQTEAAAEAPAADTSVPAAQTFDGFAVAAMAALAGTAGIAFFKKRRNVK